MSVNRRYSATEAEISGPTDWAALGARILAAARQAVAIHMAEVAWNKAMGLCSDIAEDRQPTDSAEPEQ